MRFLNDLTPATDLTYNDVFMAPARSSVTSRFDVDLTTPDGVGTTLPIAVANMTAISGRRMAETVARRGGIATLPQDIPLDVVARAVRQVKESHPVFETPIIVDPETTVGEALSLMPKRAHGAVLVVRDGKPIGVMTERDGQGVDRFAQVHDVMTSDVLTLTSDLSPQAMFDALAARHLALAPVVDGETLLGVVTRTGALRSTIYAPALDPEGKLMVGAAVGINGDVRGKAAELLAIGADVLVVDTAHGHQEKMLDVLAGRARAARRSTSRPPVAGSRSWPATS